MSVLRVTISFKTIPKTIADQANAEKGNIFHHEVSDLGAFCRLVVRVTLFGLWGCWHTKLICLVDDDNMQWCGRDPSSNFTVFSCTELSISLKSQVCALQFSV